MQEKLQEILEIQCNLVVPKNPDDHGMHIYGLAKDQNGREYYMVKNSWGDTGDYKGSWYMTKNYIAARTMDFLVNKNAIPKPIRKKLGI